MGQIHTKLTAEIDTKIYDRVSNQFQHHGQMTFLIRRLFEAIDQMIINGEKDHIYHWLYGNQTLTIPKDRGKGPTNEHKESNQNSEGS